MYKKGTSQAMWIIVSILVALVVALVIIMVFSSSTAKTSKSTDNTNDNTAAAIDAQMCQAKCDTCKQIYGGSCDWATFGGDKCVALMPSC